MTSQKCLQEPPLACLSQGFFSENRDVHTEALKEAQ